ncbi:MAG: hypothetical protein HRU38_18280 [Saccharospirillaceae bacterium]|nr:hypothetical protein [Pseudomonadales bacterium]NRB80585.1 hypothetical protein [Saccharospirillaceae bacterium]
MDRLEELEDAIIQAEQLKREFVANNPAGAGDKQERHKIYNLVERARRNLREYKKSMPDLKKAQ